MEHMIYCSLAENDVVLMVFLNVAKIYHHGLLHKIESLGIGVNLLKWIQNDLHDIYQRVVINAHNSEWKPIRAGSPKDQSLDTCCF